VAILAASALAAVGLSDGRHPSLELGAAGLREASRDLSGAGLDVAVDESETQDAVITPPGLQGWPVERAREARRARARFAVARRLDELTRDYFAESEELLRSWNDLAGAPTDRR
jgi:hypothetical protein